MDLPMEQGGPRKTSTDSLIHMSMDGFVDVDPHVNGFVDPHVDGWIR